MPSPGFHAGRPGTSSSPPVLRGSRVVKGLGVQVGHGGNQIPPVGISALSWTSLSLSPLVGDVGDSLEPVACGDDHGVRPDRASETAWPQQCSELVAAPSRGGDRTEAQRADGDKGLGRGMGLPRRRHPGSATGTQHRAPGSALQTRGAGKKWQAPWPSPPPLFPCAGTIVCPAPWGEGPSLRGLPVPSCHG